MSRRIGFAGLGDIGLPIALRLQEVLGAISVWNRTPEKADPLIDRGAALAASPRSLGDDCDLLALCLTSDDAVEAVVFGPDGVLADKRQDLTIVNLSTGRPDRSRDFAQRALQANAGWLDAPVSGGVPAAIKGTLTLFLGGEEETVSHATPLLAAIGRHWTLMGPVGAGQITKLCNQTIVATNLLAIAEAIAVGRATGIDVSQLAVALQGGFADSLPLQIFGPRMANHVYEPRLGAIGLMLKDIEAARYMSTTAKTPTPVTDFTASVYSAVEGHPSLSLDLDLSALVAMFDPLPL